MNAASFLVLLSVLNQASPYEGGSATVQEVPSEQTATGDSSFFFHLALEAGPLSLPSGTLGGGQDIFAQALPIARVERGDSFTLELGAPLRFRLIDAEPKQAAQDFSGHLRRQDWDTTSDYAQVLRLLSIGREKETVAYFYAGPLSTFQLGEGHLVDRYDNQLSPDYHPAGAVLEVNVGPTRVEVAASDILSPRLFAGELRLDIGQLASTKAENFERYYAVASVAHDFGKIGEESTESITAALLGGAAALYKGESLRLFAIGGAGSRVDVGSPDIGGFAGFSISNGDQSAVSISGRLEGRYQGGSFRFGLFGPSYELARYSSTGLHELPLAEERMDKNLAGFAELKIGTGSGAKEDLYMSASIAGEHFTTGRTDTDLTLSLQLPGARTLANARVIVVGIGTQPRYSVHAELRQRVLDWLYIWGAGGTVHFPQPDGSLAKGYTAGAGAGVDFNR
ncbi:hypothetical protein [Hyalangium minutum]|uniref:Uncharacterized protein n=1 Tax=Hyalangium minutum TaxID=394096 RepID=A0A085VZF4_9BACT|nr:hypothetical protein [Hyalangium minutum]KFE60817.1 hypothetical protein DB31_4730 [Hyalangium minutum]